MNRCSQCVLPDIAPGITLDVNGVCNYCHTYQKLHYKGEGEFLKLLDKHRRKSSAYDCMVPLSGGRDSTYTLLALVKDYKMKVLAIHYDNPFTDPQAITNIENATKILGVDLIHFKPKGELHEKAFKNNVRAWFNKPSPGLVPMICVGCKIATLDVLKFTKKNDIHCMVFGGNRFESTFFKRALLGVSANELAETTFGKVIFGVIKESIKNPAYYHPRLIPSMVIGYLFGNHYTLGSKLFGSGIDKTDLFFYIPWEEEKVVGRIRNELGWEPSPKFNSTWRFDCRVGHLKDYMYMKTVGMTERDDFYAKQVREGLIDRERALEKMADENKIYMDEVESLLKYAGVKKTPF